MLCLLKQILDNDLMFYVGPLKHAKALEDAISKTSVTSDLQSGKRGRPTWSARSKLEKTCIFGTTLPVKVAMYVYPPRK
jgi:hypothetical protein